MASILCARGLVKEFKGFTAVNGIDLDVEAGMIHALIGPNGAGKTTCFNLLTKFLEPTSGTILFRGADITKEASAQVARRGMVRSFQISAIFPHLSVFENVVVALQSKSGGSFQFWRSDKVLARLADRVRALLREVDLEHFADSPAMSLPYRFRAGPSQKRTTRPSQVQTLASNCSVATNFMSQLFALE